LFETTVTLFAFSGGKMGKVSVTKRRTKVNRSVLIVDDEKWICESLMLLLSRNGLAVNSALSGKEALRSLERNGSTLVILDYNLPDMDGIELLGQIRSRYADIPVIFMTGYGSETTSIKAFKLGITDYFIKPFHPKELENRVLEIIGAQSNSKSEFPDSPFLQQPISNDIEQSTGVGRALKHIKETYTSRITLEEVSEVGGLSRYHFTRAFKRVMGISFSDYLNHLRVKKAEEALANPDLTISEVAFSVGFNSLRQFERAFKNTSGKTPLDYRREKCIKVRH